MWLSKRSAYTHRRLIFPFSATHFDPVCPALPCWLLGPFPARADERAVFRSPSGHKMQKAGENVIIAIIWMAKHARVVGSRTGRMNRC